MYAWYYPLNKGTLNIIANLDAYSISVNNKEVKCPKKTCSIKLKSSYYNVSISRKGYYKEELGAVIKRGKTNQKTIKFKKISSLIVSETGPDIAAKKPKTLPIVLANTELLASTWSAAGDKFVYLDKGDDRLKIWDAINGPQIITTLKGITGNLNMYWSPDNKYLIGINNKDIYYIDVKNASRHKDILNFKPLNITWSLKSDYLVLNDEKNNLYKTDFSSKKIEQLSSVINLQNSIWTKGGELVFFTYDSKTTVATINSFDPIAKKSRVIITEYGFPIAQIILDNKKEIYLYNSDKKGWYRLDY